MPLWLVTVLAIVAALTAISGAFYAALPRIVQPLLRCLLCLHYRVKVTGLENLPLTGPVLIVSNHVSWLDGFFIAAFTPRRGGALVSADIVNRPIVRQLAVRSGMIPTPFSGPRAIREALRSGGVLLDRSEVLAIFPEGQITRIGMVGPFLRGMEVILRGRPHVAVVPVALDNMWGSILSASDGRFFRKWPQGWRRTVVIAFDPPLPAPVSAFSARQGVVEAVVRARALTGTPSHALETLDPALPRWVHSDLGLLAASAADYDDGYVRQSGGKPGSVGLAVPGVALRAVNGAGVPLPSGTEGRLEALLPGRPGWVDTSCRGSLDACGFVRIVE